MPKRGARALDVVVVATAALVLGALSGACGVGDRQIVSQRPPAVPSATSGMEAAAATLDCVDRACIAGKEVCCAFTEAGRNVTACAVVGDSSEERARPGLACARVHAGAADLRAFECDDSRGCAPHRVCCASIAATIHAGCIEQRNGQPPGDACPLQERCVTDASCSAQGAKCIAHACVPPHSDHIRCMGATCSAAAPYCCESPDGTFACTTREACEPDAGRHRYECTATTDCAKGLACYLDYVSGATTSCTLEGTGIWIRVCETDADCPPCGDQPAKCTHAAYSGSRSRSVGSKAFDVCACAW
jgi:hypothetical protein